MNRERPWQRSRPRMVIFPWHCCCLGLWFLTAASPKAQTHQTRCSQQGHCRQRGLAPVKPYKTANSVSCCWKAAWIVPQMPERRLESSRGEDASALPPAVGLCSSQPCARCSTRPTPPSSQRCWGCSCRPPLAGLGHNGPRNAETRHPSCSL